MRSVLQVPVGVLAGFPSNFSRRISFSVLKAPRDEVDLPGASRVVFTDEICRNVVVIVGEPMGRYAFSEFHVLLETKNVLSCF